MCRENPHDKILKTNLGGGGAALHPPPLYIPGLILSLTYVSDLTCYCITVQFYIALQLEVQEVDVISAASILVQM